MSGRGAWVEVIGLPGCGKTTFIRAHQEFLAARFAIIESREPTIASRVRARLWWMFWGRWLKLPAALARKICYRRAFRPLFCAGRPLFLFDAGIYQLVLEYLIENDFRDEAAITAALPRLPGAGRIIHMRAGDGVAAARELARAERRFPGLGAAELAARYRRAEEFMAAHIFPLAERVHTVNLATDKDFKEVFSA